jgi:hypothetical protein
MASAHVAVVTPGGINGTRICMVAACARACERAPSVELVLGMSDLLALLSG